MLIIVLFVALSFDTGMLVIEKNRLQDATDSAVLTGVLHLDDDPILISDSVNAMLAENGIRAETAELDFGYYDENDVYPDFTTYTEFASLYEGEMPAGIYPNAVMLTLHSEVTTLEVKSEDGEKARVGAQAVAYLKRLAFVALGDGGFKVEPHSGWGGGYPRFLDASIHSNADISFNGTEAFDANTGVEAVGSVTNCPQAVEGTNRITVPQIDWTQLKAEAQRANSRIYYPEDWSTSGQESDDLGNEFGRGRFVPAPGDHGGRTYYFAFRDSGHSPSDMQVWINCDLQEDIPNRESWNFTIACEGDMKIGPEWNYDQGITMGKPDNGVVTIYTAGNLEFQDRSALPQTTQVYISNGLIVHAAGQFKMITACNDGDDPSYHRIRVIADEIVLEKGGSWWGSSKGIVTFDGMFGPPNPPLIPKIGQLTKTE